MPHPKDIEAFEEELHGLSVTTVHIRTKKAAEQLKRTVGSYITIETKTTLSEHPEMDKVGECLAEVLDRVLRPYYGGTLCICGLGNREFPADALGPEVTRNLPLKLFSDLGLEGNFHNVVSFEPGVAGINNINTEVLMGDVVKALQADCLLLVDSMASEDPSRLFQTIQLSTSGGLSPRMAGRKANWEALGIPVISLGVPLSIPLSALIPGQNLTDGMGGMFTSIKIRDVVIAAGYIIAYAIIRACWPSQSKVECFAFSGLNRNPISYSLLQEGEPDAADLA